MTRKTFFSALIILLLFPGCSLIHKVFRKQEVPAPHRQVVRKPIPRVQLNAEGPPSKIVNRYHTYVYETVHSAGTGQFIITDMPILVKPPERAIKVRINMPPPTVTHKPMPVATRKKGDSFASAGSKQKPTTQSMKAVKTVRVFFELDSCTISQEASRKLRDFVRNYVHLLKNSELLSGAASGSHEPPARKESSPPGRAPSVDITGYTCWLGSKKYNQSLALRRANAVALSLKKAGVTIRSVSGKGKCCYIDRKHPAPNRRAEVTVVSRREGILPLERR